MMTKEDLKDLGKIAWGVLGIILLVTVLLGSVAAWTYGVSKTSLKEHFQKVHHVECEH